MEWRKGEHGYMIVLSRKEKVVESLTKFCAEEGITSGSFRGIGAVKNATIGYYTLAKKEYVFKTFPEDMEVASLMGNITLVDGKPFLHTHAVLSKMDNSLACIGAHVKEAEVAVTLEVFLMPSTVTVARELDDSIGLKLMQFK